MAMMKVELPLELKDDPEGSQADDAPLAELLEAKNEMPDFDMGNGESKMMEIQDKAAAQAFLLTAFKKMIEKHGGPTQYLCHVHGEPGKEFADELRQSFHTWILSIMVSQASCIAESAASPTSATWGSTKIAHPNLHLMERCAWNLRRTSCRMVS